MPDIVEVRLQIHVDDASLVLHNRLCHTQDGVMGRAFWAIAVPTRLEVRFKDGFQDELEGSLDHTVTDGRNREEAGTCAAFLRNRLVPQPHGVIRAGDQCVLEWLEEGLDPVCLTGLKRHPSTPWSTVVFFGQSVGFAERVQLADMDVPAPETPGRFSLRLGGYPPAQVWQTHGCLSHCTPASQVVEGVTNRRVPLLHGHYPASALLRTPPSPSRLRLISRWTGYTTYLASADFAAGRGGLLLLLSVSLSPCYRSHPAGVIRRGSQSATAPAAFAFPVAGSASGAAHLPGHPRVRLRYGLETRPHPVDEAVERLQKVGCPSPCSPSYRALAFPLVGLFPTEHASLRWTHNRACGFHRTRLTKEGHL